MTSPATPSPAPLVLLDLDGTLTDSAPGIMSSAAHALETLGLAVPSTEVLRTFVGPPITVSFLEHGVAPEQMVDAVAAYRRVFAAGGMFDNAVYDGIPEVLRSLRAAGCTLGIATSKPQHFAEPICAYFGLDVLVDGIWGAPPDDMPSTKATVIAQALTDLGRDGLNPGPARTVMVGDREHDVHGAAVHSIACLGVRWGYAPAGELEAAGAAGIVDRTTDLVDAVLARLEAQVPVR